MKFLRPALGALALLALAGCSAPEQTDYQARLLAFGTLVDVNLYGVPTEQAQAAVQAVDQLFQKQHHDWHAWQRGELDSLNQAFAKGETRQTDPSIIRLIHMAQRFESLSGGLFNPAIGHLLSAWGFQQDEPGREPPAPAAVQHWLKAAPSTGQIDIKGTQVSSSNPAVKLDFGGFAKGYSVATAVALLEKRGIHNLIVNAGGDLCLRGRHGERPWRIGIRSPDGEGVLATLELEGAQCVFTSGDYERYFEYRGKRYGHILNPRSGFPATGVHSVTVLSPDAALADAAATALFVAGVPGWQATARRMGVSDVLLVDAEGDAYVTEAMRSRVHFTTPPRHLYTVRLTGQNDE